MQETELKPIEEKVKEQANQYIHRILIELGRFHSHDITEKPTVIMTKDVFNVLQAGLERDLYVNTEIQTICGCKVDVVSGTEKLYVGLNLIERWGRQ